MSTLSRAIFRPLPNVTVSRPVAITNRRYFHVTRVRSALSESDRHRDDIHEEIEHHKNDQLEKQKNGKGEWKRELASNSEAALKADRGEMKASDEHIEELQKQTSDHSQSQHEHGKK
ncbi:hypothetical protein MMC20_000307 [Loxospora ochrophaea]|nr:hypothetical protein [Loxospora ochrophaea]